MVDFLRGVLEEDLYPPMIEYFKKLGYSIELEIPLHRNRIDLVAFNQNRLIAVELKLKNWRRALRQAEYYQLGSDFSYISMPFYQAIQVYKYSHLIEGKGVGLFGVLLNKGEVRELIQPKLSPKKIDYMFRGIFSTIRRRW